VLLTILPAGVAAAEPPAAHQYLESVPPTAGDRGSDTAPNPTGTQLADSIERRIEARGGEDADALKALASSGALGAPQSTGSDASPADRTGDDDSPSGLGAAISAPTDGDAGAIGALLGGVLAVTAVAAATVAARRRRSQR
jgi:hypothetical protein